MVEEANIYVRDMCSARALELGAGIFYYRALVNAHLASALSPHIVMVHANVQKVMSLANARESRQLADYLVGLLRQLAGGGAQIATIPAFSPQVCAQELAERTPLPLISLLDAIIAEVSRRRLARVAVFGARVTHGDRALWSLAGCDGRYLRAIGRSRPRQHHLRGDRKERKGLRRRAEALRTLAHLLIERESLDAILLAGTDFSFVFDPGNTDFPHLDGARTHIDAIMRRLTC